MKIPLLVRCLDRMVFEIDRATLEPKQCSYYDAHCYSDERGDVDYIEHHQWDEMKRKREAVK